MMAANRARPLFWLALLVVLVCTSLAAANPGALQVVPDQESEAEAVDAPAGGNGDGGPLETMMLQEGMSEQELLHWALQHSDKEELARKAEEIRMRERGEQMKGKIADMQDLIRRRKEIRQVLDDMNKMPTEAALMKMEVEVLVDPGANASSLETSLLRMQELVEPIDNANDLHAVGGLVPICGLLRHGDARVKSAALYVIGTAASNNVKFQERVLEIAPDVLDHVLTAMLAQGDDEELAGRAMYAAGALLRNSLAWREKMYDTGGVRALGSLVAHGSSPRLQRRALQLLSDMAQLDGVGHPDMQDQGIMCAIVVLVAHEDLPTMEAALRAVPLFADEATGNLQRLHTCQVGPAMAEVQMRLQREAETTADADRQDYIRGVTQLLVDVATALLPGGGGGGAGGGEAGGHAEL